MKTKTYLDKTYFYGQLWIWTAVVLLLAVPAAITVYYHAWPGMEPILTGLVGVAPIYWTVGAIEVLTFSPMLGTGGTFLAFVTGNLTNLKVPCALNAMENAKVKPGTEEGEIISTIAVATSAIVTTVIIAAGVLLLAQLAPIINSPALKPAFDNILPSLFGGLAVVYVSKNWKISMAPMLFMIVLFLCVPSLSGKVGILVPVGAILSIVIARLLYKKNLL